jgi:hypothetical protein
LFNFVLMIDKLLKNKSLFYILVGGAVFRLLFITVGAYIYFGRSNIFVDGDTSAWAHSFQNLLELGHYTANPEKEMGAFNRLPGYSFFLGLFYIICGHDWQTTYKVVGWAQTLLDISLIPVIYAVAKVLLMGQRPALIASALYAFYPFVIVWNPVCYSEYMSIFIMGWSLFFLLRTEVRYNYAVAGALLGLGGLFRPQLLLLAPGFGLYILYLYRQSLVQGIKHATIIAVFFILSYGSWPLRNFINYGKIIPVQDLTGANNWSPDVIAYMQYMFAIKTDWFPQFTQIIENKPYEISPFAYASKQDSLKLLTAIDMAKNCSRGFSHWRGYWKDIVPESADCGKELEQYFTELRANIIKAYPVHFYLIVPLNNLKKALFKISLSDTKTMARKAASVLFIYRTLLIILGLTGAILMFLGAEHQLRSFALLSIIYFLIVYLFLCAGTGTQTRNIEMRYFLHPDLILLFPAAFLINRLSIKKHKQIAES